MKQVWHCATYTSESRYDWKTKQHLAFNTPRALCFITRIKTRTENKKVTKRKSFKLVGQLTKDIKEGALFNIIMAFRIWVGCARFSSVQSEPLRKLNVHPSDTRSKRKQHQETQHQVKKTVTRFQRGVREMADGSLHLPFAAIARVCMYCYHGYRVWAYQLPLERGKMRRQNMQHLTKGGISLTIKNKKQLQRWR